jgi:hypothetical protein
MKLAIDIDAGLVNIQVSLSNQLLFDDYFAGPPHLNV